MKRVFILTLDSSGQSIFDYITDLLRKHKLSKEVELIIHNSTCHLHLPKGFDLYIIHFSKTSERALEELREKQPQCIIVLLTGNIVPKPASADHCCRIIRGDQIKFYLSEIGIDIPLEKLE